MMAATDAIARFEAFWREFEPGANGPHIHPKDRADISDRDRELMQFDLLPIPVNGNLRTAEVLILMLNPGFGSRDAEWGTPATRQILRAGEMAALHQGDWSGDYPIFDLDPALVGSGGARFWGGEHDSPTGKFGHVITALAEAGTSFTAARRALANRVAIVQLVAYRSTSFSALQQRQRRDGPPQDRLESSTEALTLARALIAENRRLVIVPYGIDHWKTQEGIAPNLVVYPPGRRSAHFAPTSPGYGPFVRRMLT